MKQDDLTFVTLITRIIPHVVISTVDIVWNVAVSVCTVTYIHVASRPKLIFNPKVMQIDTVLVSLIEYTS